MKRLVIPAQADRIEAATAAVEDELDKGGCGPGEKARLLICVDEILTNIVRYAYPAGGGTIWLACKADEGRARLIFQDEGIPFNPLKIPEPDVTLPIEERNTGGLGIFLVKKSVDKMEYAYQNGRNILILEKAFSKTQVKGEKPI